MTAIPFGILAVVWPSVPVKLLVPGLTLDHDITSQKNGMLVHLNRHLSLLNFRFVCLHILSALSSVASWLLPMSFNPSIKMLSAMPNTFGNPRNSSSIFLWNIPPAGATINGSHIYLYLPKGQQKAVRYNDCSSNFKLFYLKLT